MTNVCVRRWCGQMFLADRMWETTMLKGLALWALGLPLPIILVLYLFNIL